MPNTLLIQPAGADTYMQANTPDTNYGSQTELNSIPPGATTMNMLLKFDLSSIPSEAVLVSVTLYLYKSADAGGVANVCTLYRVYRAWTGAGATFNKYDGTNNWGTAGCENTTTDRTSTALGTLTLSGTGAWATSALDLTEFTTMWKGTNNGFMVRTDSGNLQKKVYSSDYAVDTTLCPYLSIVYRSRNQSGVAISPASMMF